MDISPQTVRTTSFKLVKKGYDPDEVDSFKEQVAAAVEHAQNQATAMEARARAAVAKLREVSQQVGTVVPAAPSHSGDTEVISRTLLLAQRTADATVAEARVEADQTVNKAREEAGRVLDSARNMAAKTVDDARFEARRAAEDERVKAENEVQALLARRDFLLADVDHLEQYLQAQRERLRDAAVQLHELIERVPGGLGDMRRPLLSASAEPLPPELEPAPPAPERLVEVPSVKLNLDSLPAPRFADDPTTTTTSSIDAVPPAPPAGQEDPSERVWRMLDEEVASGRGNASDVTGELPLQTSDREPFRFDDEELQ
jgi:DivIVA domain-containing protein